MALSALALKIQHYVQTAGASGVTQSDLRRRYRTVNSGGIRAAVLELTEAGTLHARQQTDPTQLGRRPTRYYHADFTEHLTSLEALGSVKPVPLAYSESCSRCGVAISSDTGLHSICTACDVATGRTLRGFLGRVPQGVPFLHAAQYLVAADLSIRGFGVSFPQNVVLPRLVVWDSEGNLILLDIVTGPCEDTSFYTSVAVVYDDGLIEYAGQNPLVIEEPASEDAQAVDVPPEPEPTSDVG